MAAKQTGMTIGFSTLYAGFLIFGIPFCYRKYDNFSTNYTHSCLSKSYVPVQHLENHMIEKCKNGGICKIRLDTHEHRKKADEIAEKHFKNNYYVSTGNCYECKKLMDFMFVKKVA